MAIDAYAICPGGTGKKIKFCCPDFLPELEKIDRMMEGEQYLACCQHIEQLEQGGQRRQCLMALKAMLLRVTDQLEAAEPYVAEFQRQFPENPLAWAEAAILTAAGQTGRAALPKLERAIALSGKSLLGRVYDAIGIVADVLMEEGEWSAGRALWRLQAGLRADDPAPGEKLVQAYRATDIPLLIKDEPAIALQTAEAPWKGRFEEAMAALRLARWQETAERLTALAKDVPDAPLVWHDLALVRQWLADDEGAILAWRQYARLPVPLENAVEAEARAMLLAKDPLGDAVDWLRLDWPVRDAERLQEVLLSVREFDSVPMNPAAMAGEDSPPPRLVGMLLDRPLVETAEGFSRENASQILAQAMLFGRQTDRAARLELQAVSAADAGAVKTLLRKVCGDLLEGEPHEEAVGQTSATQQLLSIRWYPPRGVSREQYDVLAAEQLRDAVLTRWPERPLGVLDGRSPREAAADPDARIRLLATIFVLGHFCERAPGAPDFNELRSRLGLPLLEPIELAPGQMDTLPLVRLARVRVEKLSDDDLVSGFRRSILFHVWNALRKLAREVIERPSFADRPERFQAYSMLAQSAENFEEAVARVDEGRRAAEAKGRSCASWDLLELSFRLAQGDGHAAMRLVQHVESRHMREPGVAQTLTQMLIDVGLLRPDGSPAAPPRQEAAGPIAAEPAAAEPAKIWTPGSESSGGGKIWTPG